MEACTDFRSQGWKWCISQLHAFYYQTRSHGVLWSKRGGGRAFWMGSSCCVVRKKNLVKHIAFSPLQERHIEGSTSPNAPPTSPSHTRANPNFQSQTWLNKSICLCVVRMVERTMAASPITSICYRKTSCRTFVTFIERSFRSPGLLWSSSITPVSSSLVQILTVSYSPQRTSQTCYHLHFTLIV